MTDERPLRFGEDYTPGDFTLGDPPPPFKGPPLIQFLTARLDEDEAVAQAAQGSDPWESEQERSTLLITTHGDDSSGWEFAGGSGVWNCDDYDDDCHLHRASAEAEAEHITRHDPSRVLAEVAAKREIMALGWQDFGADNSPRTGGWDGCLLEAYEAVLQVLALPYKDHPEYRQEWAA